MAEGRVPELKLVFNAPASLEEMARSVINLALNDMPDKVTPIAAIVEEHLSKEHLSNISLWDALSKELPSEKVNAIVYSLVEGGILRAQ